MKASLPVIDSDVCAPDTLHSPLDRAHAESVAVLLKAVADPTRLQLIALLNASPQSEACVCNLTEPLGLSQPTISHHLKVLNEVGIIKREKRGTWVWYSVDQNQWSKIAQLFS